MAPTSAVQDLGKIPLNTLIGGPLIAAIEAQALAARTTVEFINDVGLTKPNTDGGITEVRQVSLSYSKADADGVSRAFELSVPFLTIVPVPYIRIETIDISFKATLTDTFSTYDSERESSFAGVTSSSRWYSSQTFRMSQSKNNTTINSTNGTREYVYNVNVHATQDEMPGGLGRILGILEHSMGEGSARKTLPAVTGTPSGSTVALALSDPTIPAAAYEIRYTVDGTIPNQTNSPVYSTAIVLGGRTTVKAVAYQKSTTGDKLNPSPLFQETYL